MTGGFIKTATHNYVSRDTKIEGAQFVELRGKSVLHRGVEVRGDLARIKAGRYCTVGPDTVLQPAPNNNVPVSGKTHVPLVIGSHTKIGPNCKIEAAAVGSNVIVGRNVVLGKRCIVRDNCIVEDESHVADDTVIPPFSRVRGKPAHVIEELPESSAVLLADNAIQQYKDFVDSNPIVS